MLDVPLVDLQLPNRITTTDVGLQFISSKSGSVTLHLYTSVYINLVCSYTFKPGTYFFFVIDTSAMGSSR